MLTSGEATIWMVQADHLSGETLGVVLQRLLDLGAMNVQIIPTITKKNRPGHLIFIDVVAEQSVDLIEDFLVRELGISGFHRWKSEHCHASTEKLVRTLRVKSKDRTLSIKVDLKVVGERGPNTYIRIEHDSCLEVQREIAQEFGQTVSLREIASIVESSVLLENTEATIELNGCRIKPYPGKEVPDGKTD